MSLAAAIVLIVTGVGLTAGVLVKVFVLPLRRLARETSLIATANPAYRIDTWRLPPLRGLAVAIDELAERAEAAQGELDERIAAARMDLERERNTLAALMSELSLPVLVCNPEGQILLYNVAARELLDPGGRPSGLVGLGRSIFGILDRSLFNHALGRARAGDGGGGQGMRLAATAVGGQLLRVGVAPVRRGDAEPAGFVLTLEDVTRRAEVGARRDALLRSLTEGTRASVGAIRAAIESLLDYPGMEAAERQRFMTIIREEAVALGTRVEDALCESAASLGSEWRLAEILARDLVAALQRRLESEEGPATADPAVAAGEVGDKLWLRVDSYAVVQAVAHLALRLRSEAGVARLALDLREAGRYARLDLSWDGRPLDAETLRAWSEEPLDAEGSGIPSNVNAVVERHGGEVWAQAEPDERARVRLLLPAAEAAHSGRPEAARRTQAAVESRPEFYDFDLFRAAERGSGWDKRGLDELAYTVFDTETTGLQPSSDEIISIGAVRVVNGRLLRQETFDQLVDPRREVSPLSVRIHGIEAELLRGQPTIEEVLPLFARFCEDTVLVGHNVGFDLRFLELKEEVTSVRLAQPVLDTLLLDAVAEPDEEDHSLEAMSARLGISAIGRHTALGDAILTGEIFLAQLRLLAAQGIRTLDEAREAAHSTYLARVSESLYSGA